MSLTGGRKGVGKSRRQNGRVYGCSVDNEVRKGHFMMDLKHRKTQDDLVWLLIDLSSHFRSELSMVPRLGIYTHSPMYHGPGTATATLYPVSNMILVRSLMVSITPSVRGENWQML